MAKAKCTKETVRQMDNAPATTAAALIAQSSWQLSPLPVQTFLIRETGLSKVAVAARMCQRERENIASSCLSLKMHESLGQIDWANQQDQDCTGVLSLNLVQAALSVC